MKLPKETTERFVLNPKLKGGPVFHFGKYGTIDLSKLTLKRAEQLVKAQFPHLKEKKTKSVTTGGS